MSKFRRAVQKLTAIHLIVACLLMWIGGASAFELIRKKNVATSVRFPITYINGTLVTGAAGLDTELSYQDTEQDTPSNWTDTNAEATEVQSSGQYYVLLNASEMNHLYIWLQTKTSTVNATTQTIPIRTIIGVPANISTTDDGSAINVTNGVVDTVTTTGTATAVTTVNGLAAGIVTAAAIATGAIDADAIADDAIDAGAIAAGAITSSEAPALQYLTGDAYVRLGSPAGASVSVDIAAVKSDTAAILVDTAAMDTSTELRTLLTGSDTAVSTLTESSNIGINWADISNPTTAVDLSGTNFDVDQVIASASGAVGSVTGAVGSVTGNVGGNVTGTIGGMTAAALADMFDTNSGTTYASAVSGSVVKEIVDNAGGSSLTESGIADAVWDEARSGHTSAGTFGLYLDAQVSTVGGGTLTAADIWAYATRTLTAGTNIALAKGTGVTGFNDLDAAGVAGAVWNAATASYGTAGTYGLLIETNLDATITSVYNIVNHATYGNSALNTKLGTTAGASVSADIAMVKSDTGAILIDTSAVDTSAELRTLLTGSDTAVSTYTGGDTSGTTTLLSRLSAVRAGYLDYLDAAITSRMATFTVPTNFSSLAITAGGAVTVGTNNDKTGYSILAGDKDTLVDLIWNELQSGHTTASTFGYYLDSRVSQAGSGGLTAAAIADAVWDEVMSGHITPSTAGKYLLDAQAAGNPWATDISTGYTGQAGEMMRRVDKNTRMIR